MRAVFIRHGQSSVNAGIPCHDLATIELTEKGWGQARRVADDWAEEPSLIPPVERHAGGRSRAAPGAVLWRG